VLELGGDLDLAAEAVPVRSAASSGERSLMTTFRLDARSIATNARLIPPPLSSRSMV